MQTSGKRKLISRFQNADYLNTNIETKIRKYNIKVGKSESYR